MAATIRALPTDPLMARIAPVAAHVRNASKPILRLLRLQPDPECAGRPDIDHYIATAVFESFIEMGGDAAAPEAFAWHDHHGALTRMARRKLHTALRGRQSSYGDFRSRRIPDRRESRRIRLLPEHCWQQEPSEPTWLEELAGTLEGDLAAVLTPRELHVVTQVALRGRRLRDVAKEEAAADPRYGPDGWSRLEGALEKVYSRALVRAKARLAARRAALLAA